MTVKYAERQLVYFVYGEDKAYFHEAKFSVVSALRNQKTAGIPRILILTDNPDEFSGWPVDVVLTDQKTLRDWRGSEGYIHRQKACAIKYANQYADHSVFIDTDTVFVRPAASLFELLEASSWVVDEVEATWADWKNVPLYDLAAGYLRQHYEIGDELRLVNSGVLGVRDEHESFADRTIELIDEIIALAPNVYVIEQFAASLAGHRLGPPAETRQIVTHYFSTKLHWRRMFRDFFSSYGETYSERLLSASLALPRVRLRPSGMKRSFFRLATAGLGAHEKKRLRMLYYAVNLPKHPYAKPYALGYLDYFREYSPDKQISPTVVRNVIELRPALFSTRQSDFIFGCLEQMN